MSSAPVKFGIFGPMYPPMDACLAAVPRAEKLGRDFIDYPGQLQSTHPLGMLKPPVPKSGPGRPTSFYSEVWYGSNMAASADPEHGEHWERLISDVLVRLGRAPLTMDEGGRR